LYAKSDSEPEGDSDDELLLITGHSFLIIFFNSLELSISTDLSTMLDILGDLPSYFSKIESFSNSP
jgi:hypothetical protein